MATNPFDRMALNLGERPVSTDVNQLQSDVERSLMQVVQALVRQFSGAGPGSGSDNPAAAVFFDGYYVTAAGLSMNIVLAHGLGVKYDPTDVPGTIGGLSGIDDLSAYKPLVLAADQTIAVPAADPSNPRIDIIEVNTSRRLEQPASRDILNPSTGVVTPASVNKVLAYYQDNQIGNFSTGNSTTGIGYKLGTPAGSPSAPATTAGYTVVAQIAVGAAATTISQGNVTDLRKFAIPAAPSGYAQMMIDVRQGDTAAALTSDGAEHKFNSFTLSRRINVNSTVISSDGTGRITAGRSGVYRIFASMSVEAVTSSAITLNLLVYKNGSRVNQIAMVEVNSLTAGDIHAVSGEMPLVLAVGDFVELWYNAGSGTSSGQKIEAGQFLAQII